MWIRTAQVLLLASIAASALRAGDRPIPVSPSPGMGAPAGAAGGRGADGAVTPRAGVTLGFPQRVRAQEAIERVYNARRIWPQANAGPKPPFERLMPERALEEKVRVCLERSDSFEAQRGYPLGPEELDAELERMRANSADPETLRALFAALGDDPLLLRECLARPALVDRAEFESRSPLSVDLGRADSAAPAAAPRAPLGTPNTWLVTSTGGGCPMGRYFHTAVWTGAEMIVWGGFGTESPYYTNTGGRYAPATDSWAATSTAGDCPSSRDHHTAVWTGTEMIVWGGYGPGAPLYRDSGGRYTPSTDTWVATPTGGNCPSGRDLHTAVWTGSEMVVWGGHDGVSGSSVNTGGRYLPSADTWTAVSTGPDCPAGREAHTAVWTGTEMIVWGGLSAAAHSNSGGRYSPASDTWAATSTGASCPSSRDEHTAVWTGTEMIIWGGNNGATLDTGGRYTPSTDSWTATSTDLPCPSTRDRHTAIWTGREMIVWGGYGPPSPYELDTGGRYAPSTDTWETTSTGTNCPVGRDSHTAVWTGLEMVVWGGYGGWETGGRYTPPIYTVPDAPGAPSFPAVTCSSVTVTWPEVLGATSYDVYRAAGSTCAGAAKVNAAPVLAGVYEDAAVSESSGYSYFVVAVNAYGPSGDGACGSVTTSSPPLPETPTGVTATPACAGNTIAWEASAQATAYEVKRGAACGTGEATFTSAASPYTDATASEGTTYDYWVVAKNACGTSADSACASATRPGVPAAPTGVAAAPSCADITVSWTGNPQATSYSVRRGSTCGTTQATFAGVTSPYTDATAVAGTTYRYWVLGTNDCGDGPESACASASVPTDPAAPAAPTFASVGCTAQTVNWTAVAGATSYDVYRALGGSCAGAVKVNASPVTGTTYADTGLTELTQYSYYLVANNACGTSPDGACASSTTVSSPAAPADVTATGTCTAIVVTWSPVAGATSYDVRRGTACGTVLTTLTNRTSPFTDTSASLGTTYTYWVVAKNGCGTSANSPCASATRLGAPAPTGVTAVPSCSAITISWTGNPQATSYSVRRGTTCGTTQVTFAGVTSPYTDTTAVAGTTYRYWVIGTNECGNSPNSTCATTTLQVTPAAPAAPTFASVGCTAQTVNWTAVTGATSYDLYRAVGGSCAGAVKVNASPVTGTTYADTGLTELTQYSYYLVAASPCGVSPDGACASSTTVSLPAAPADVTATGTCAGNVITWSPVAGATSYDIRRGTACGTVLTTLTNRTSPFTDTSAAAGTTYAYWVVAKNACGTSTDSPCASATRLGAPAAPTGVTAVPSCSDIAISWTGNPQATSYSVRRGAACGTTQVTFADVTSPYADTTAVAGTTYRYWVIGTNECGNSPNSTCATTTLQVTPAAPAAPTFASVGCTAQTVNWTAVTGATSYDLYRAVGGSCAGAVKVNASPVTGTTYADTGLTELTQYSYYLVAVSPCGISPDGACASSTTGSLAGTPADVTATGTCAGNVITWSPVAGATSYDIRRGSVCGTVVATLANHTSPFTDTSAVAGTTYAYWVVAKNACGTSANSACATAVRPAAAPAVPSGVTAVGLCTGVSVSWNAAARATSYNVLRGTACGTAVDSFADVASPFVDTTAAVGSPYQYWVVAVNSCGSSNNSTCAGATRPEGTLPEAVGDTLSLAPSGSNLVLTWTDIPGATGYSVFSDSSAGGTFSTPVGSATSGTTGLSVAMPSSALVFYRVAATNACGSGPK